MHTVKEIRAALRALARHPGQSAVIIVTCGLGIGLATLMFSILYGNVIRGLPFENSDRLFSIERTNTSVGMDKIPVSLHDFAFWQERQVSFEDLAAWQPWGMTVSNSGQLPEQYNGAQVTASFFELVSVPPSLGRVFDAGDESLSAEPVVIISDAMWRARFGQVENILGQTLKVYGEPTTIVGVMPRGFRFPYDHDLWLPLRHPELLDPKSRATVRVFGQLKGDSSLEQARVEFETLATNLAAEFPETHEGIGVYISPYVEGFSTVDERQTYALMLAASLIVLVICCANVLNLLLLRFLKRSRELAVRISLGAARWRIVSTVLIEILVYVLGGVVLGLAITRFGIHLYSIWLVDVTRAYWEKVAMDVPVFLFVLAAAMATAFLAGFYPAIQASRRDPKDALNEHESPGSKGIGSSRRLLVIAQITLTFVLLIATGLILRSLSTLYGEKLAILPDNTLTAEISVLGPQYKEESQRAQYFNTLLSQIREIPGIAHAALSFPSSPIRPALDGRVAIEGQLYDSVEDYPSTKLAVISEEFFEVLGKAPIQGRTFRASDTASSGPVVIINESFAKKFFEQDPLGRHVDVGGVMRRVIGVVPDLLLHGLGGEASDGLYVPVSQVSPSRMVILVSTQGDPKNSVKALREVVAGLGSDQAINRVLAGTEAKNEVVDLYRTSSIILSLFGMVTLLLSTIGLYGVISASIAQRRKSIGIRLALGAGVLEIVRLLLRDILWLFGIGTALGLVIVSALSGVLSSLVYQGSTWDPALYFAVFCVLALTGVMASWIPAIRVARSNPRVVLGEI